MRADRAVGVGIVAVLAVLVVGCAASAPLPASVAVDLYQTRLDVAERLVEIAVVNGGDAPITVTGAVLDSERFADPSAWPGRDGGATIAPGAALDLPVPLPTVRCEAPGSPVDRVRLSFETAAGSGTALLDVADRFGQLAELHELECRAEAVATVAAIGLAAAPSIGEAAGAPAIVAPIAIEPTGADGAIVLSAVRSTVLLSLVDPATGAPVPSLLLDRRVAGDDAPAVLELAMVPARCDPHVVTEDKQGTLLPLEVIGPDGAAGELTLRMDDAARNAVYAAIGALCGFPDG